MNQKLLAIAAIVIVAALTGIFSTPLAAYASDGDSSETGTDQSMRQKNVGSGDSVNFCAAQNLIKAGVRAQDCGNGERGNSA